MNVFNVKYNVYTKKGCKSKFIVIGDLHGWVDNEQIGKVVDNIKDGNPDIIFIAGDILAESYQWTQRGKVTEVEKLLKSLTEGGADVVTVLGNHDTHVLSDELMYNYMNLENIDGVHPLHNTSVDIEKNGESIHIAGVTTEARDGVTAVTNLKPRFTGIDERPQRIVETIRPLLDLDENQINILLMHDPRQLRMPEVDAATKKFDLRMAAHIHNGYLPFKISTQYKEVLDQDWAHYLYLGIPKLKTRNFARGIAYGNQYFYILCTQTNDYYFVRYDEEMKDIDYFPITRSIAIEYIKEYDLTPTVITGGVNRYVGVPFEGSEVTEYNMIKR